MYQRILVPIDGSPTSQRGLLEAIDIARLTKGRLRLLHVIDELSAARCRSAYTGFTADWVNEVKRDGYQLLHDACIVVQDQGVEVETFLHSSFSPHLADVVQAEAIAWGAELIVIGTHGRRGVARFLMGSGAESILRSAKVPVLLVRNNSEAEPKQAEETVHVRLATGALTIE